PTPARRDSLARALAASSAPIRVTVWTPERSALEALADVLPARPRASGRPPAEKEISDPDHPTDLAPPPAPHA
ncbi:MAG: hypothetical protein ACRDL0_03690, partial [Thermoleophilaceae bacterium]